MHWLRGKVVGVKHCVTEQLFFRGHKHKLIQALARPFETTLQRNWLHIGNECFHIHTAYVFTLFSEIDVLVKLRMGYVTTKKQFCAAGNVLEISGGGAFLSSGMHGIYVSGFRYDGGKLEARPIATRILTDFGKSPTCHITIGINA